MSLIEFTRYLISHCFETCAIALAWGYALSMVIDAIGNATPKIVKGILKLRTATQTQDESALN